MVVALTRFSEHLWGSDFKSENPDAIPGSRISNPTDREFKKKIPIRRMRESDGSGFVLKISGARIHESDGSGFFF